MPKSELKSIDADIQICGFDGVGTLLETGPTVETVESEMQNMPHLEDDLRLEDDPETVHECRDVRGARLAAEQIRRIPGARECFHLLCSGRYALWDMVPAILSLAAPATIASLHIATLGFSKSNIADLVALLDAGTIGRVSLICSHYFKGTSTAEWNLAETELAKRSTRARFLSIRNHCKLLAIKLTDGRTVTIETSANLRSCRNIEQMTVFGNPAVYEFHTKWMDGLTTAQASRDRL